MILKTITDESKKTYSSVVKNYETMLKNFLREANIFADYSNVYSILSESSLYSKRKKYEVSVKGQSFFFEAPLWFENQKVGMLEKYGKLGDAFYSLYLHIVWNRNREYARRKHEVEIKNPPNIGELVVDVLNGKNSEASFRFSEEFVKHFGKVPNTEEEFVTALRKLEKHYAKENRNRLNPIEEDLKNSFSAKGVKSLMDFSKSEKGLFKHMILPETSAYLVLVRSKDDVHQAEYMLNQKLWHLTGEPMDVIVPDDRFYGPIPFNKKFLERQIENYHFRFQELISILERKSKSVLNSLDAVDKTNLSISAEFDVSEFLDFLHEQKNVLKENEEKEKNLLPLYFT